MAILERQRVRDEQHTPPGKVYIQDQVALPPCREPLETERLFSEKRRRQGFAAIGANAQKLSIDATLMRSPTISTFPQVIESSKGILERSELPETQCRSPHAPITRATTDVGEMRLLV